MEKHKNRKGRLSFLLSYEAIIVGLVTIYAYLFVYMYERSFVAYFHIPAELVSISPEVFFRTLFGLGGVLFLFYMTWSFIMFLFPIMKSNRIHWDFFRFVAVYLLVIVPTIYKDEGFAHHWWIYLFILVCILVIQFGYPLIYRNKKTYIEKLEEASRIDSEHPSIFEKFGDLFGDTGSVWILGGFYFLFLASVAGHSNARDQKEFLVMEVEDSQVVVLRTYGDKMITAPLSEQKNRIKRKFHVIYQSDLKQTSIEREEVGPLTRE